MPCINPNHTHIWTTTGELTIERCEKFCFFCTKQFKHAWFLRRHVKNVHEKEFPDLIVLEGWSGSPSGNRWPRSAEGRGRRSRTRSVNRVAVGSENVIAELTPPNINPVPITMTDSAIDLKTTILPISTTDPFLLNFNSNLDTNTSVNFTTQLDSNISADPITQAYPATNTYTTFVTPQTVRTNGKEIQILVPEPAHHSAAQGFADGLNSIVADLVGSGVMEEAEVLYVLETYTSMFKMGWGLPF